MADSRVENLFFVLASNSGNITAKEIALKTGLSERTVFSVIPYVKNYAEQNGARLIAKRGNGYRLEITDGVAYQNCVEYLDMLYHYSGREDRMARRFGDELLVAMVNGVSFQTAEDISVYLFISDANTHQAINAAEKILENRNLKIKHSSKNGYQIIGDEFDYRLLIIQLHNADSKSISWFSFESNSEVRRALTRNLVRHGIRIRDRATVMMEQYIALAEYRLSKGYSLDFNMATSRDLEMTEEYKCATDMMNECENTLRNEHDEILGIALSLIVLQDYQSADSVNKYPFIKEQHVSLMKEFSELLQRFHFPADEMPLFEPMISAAFTDLLTKQHFRKSEIRQLTESRMQNFIQNNCYAMFICSIIQFILPFELTHEIITNFIRYLVVPFNNVHYPVKKLKIATSSSYGFLRATTLKYRITERFSRYVETVDPHELYELRYIDKDRYDCLIINYQLPNYRYDWNYLNLSVALDNEDMMKTHEFLIRQSIDVESMFRSAGWEGTYGCYRYEHVRNADVLLRNIASKWGLNDASESELFSFLKDSLWRSISRDRAVLIVPSVLASRNFFEYYETPRMHRTQGHRVTRFFVMSMDIGYDILKVRFMHDLCSALFQVDMDGIASGLEENLKKIHMEYITRKGV